MQQSASGKSLASASEVGASPGSKASPRMAQMTEMKAWNRSLLKNVASLLSVSDTEENADGMQTAASSPKSKKSEKSRRSSPKRLAGVQSARETRQEFEARRRKQEHMARHKQLMDLRAEDTRGIQERCERHAMEREQRFEQMLENLRKNDEIRVAMSDRVRQHEAAERARMEAIYNEWDVQVYQRVEHRLSKYAHVAGSEATPISLGPNPRMELHLSDDPIKRALYQQRQEENFRRAADAIISDSLHRQSGSLQERIKQREKDAEAVRTRLTSRPVLPIANWEQRQHYASPYGYFAQGCEKGVGFHSARRMGTDVHRPDERDGIEAAGKTRTRSEHNSMGLLAGETAKRGESSLHKREYGASCGAPNQDHYRSARGNQVTDLEFPLGKRVFPHMLV